MNHPHEPHPDLLDEIKSEGIWQTVKLALIVKIVLLFFLVSGMYVWAQGYEGRIVPNVFVGDVDVGGLDPEQARAVLQARVDEIMTSGMPVLFQGEEKVLPFATLVGTDLVEVLTFDLDATLSKVMEMHGNTVVSDTFKMFMNLFGHTQVSVEIDITDQTIEKLVREVFPEVETLSTNASYTFAYGDGAWRASVVEGADGYEFVFEPFFETLYAQLASLDRSAIELNIANVAPLVSVEMAQAQTEQAQLMIEGAPYVLVYADASWSLTAVDLTTILQPGLMGIELNDEAFAKWVVPIQTALNITSRDARLEIDDGRVVDFVHSRSGAQVQVDLLKHAIVMAITDQSLNPIEIAVEIEEPEVQTGDVNDLGITEILGSGTSSYRGSPWNRRQNIQNGVDLLNGRLIAPDETFSLIKALRPFTFENGYLPELVIKGDKIEPELGGGLCQIGTTTFRATMNSGLEVTSRRNHSLVVSYYNDLSNGLPGTDATIYEPAPDYQFTNNTESHVLFQAENLTETSELRFTFWGTSDGRKGSYAPPVVQRWIPVGETTYIESEDLELGEETCQEAHMGADASFVYTVMSATGEIEETEFVSHYRPLPKICLVGVEEDDALEEDA